ncbi:MAG TPA: N-acetylmuramoyl-L-alanine amidase [Xanthobacteraceae bacterium]
MAARISGLAWTDWKPTGIVLHNTAAPTLAQWAESGPKHAQRIKNLQAYYEGMGWHGGPHWFVSRDFITEFSNPLRRGTHSPSFNATHFGIEMVGDYAQEAFNSGDGAKVRDNAVFLMALLCRKFGWSPGDVIKLHKEDPRTDHDCPGKNVVKADVVARVKMQLDQLGGASVSMPATPTTPAMLTAAGKRQIGITATEFGGAGDEQPSAYPDVAPGWPARPGVALPHRFAGRRARVRVFKDGRSVDCDIVDVGPWNIHDPYWQTNARPAAERGIDERGRRTNRAGIDLTPAAARAIGLGGMGVVDWEFIDAAEMATADVVSADVVSLRPGSTGERVRQLQAGLAQLGFAVGEIDGEFGPITSAAVSAFQGVHGLPATGVADQATQQVLARALVRPPVPTDIVKPHDILQALFSALLKARSTAPVTPTGDQPDAAANMLQLIVTAFLGRQLGPAQAGSAAAMANVPILSPIDNMLGGQALAGKKTALAVVGYALLAILQAVGVVGAATPAGQIITVLITAFGALGGISKVDRVIQALGMIAAKAPKAPPPAQ